MASNSAAKHIVKSIRLSLEQWRRAVRAARLETKRVGTTVYPTVLLAEVGTTGVDAILAAAEPQTAAPAA